MISEALTLDGSPHDVFHKFVREFSEWWPTEYTWSQDVLEKITIGENVGDKCSEYGPNGFRVDWGEVLQMDEGSKVIFSWQISAEREPIPDKGKASKVTVTFSKQGGQTILRLEHDAFENHGEDSEAYEKMLASEYGWPFILNRFQTFQARH